MSAPLAVSLRVTIPADSEKILQKLVLPDNAPMHLLVGKMGSSRHGMLNFTYEGPVAEVANPVCQSVEGPHMQFVRRPMAAGTLTLSFQNNLDQEQEFWFEGHLAEHAQLEILPPARGESKRQLRLAAKKQAEAAARDKDEKLDLVTVPDEEDDEGAITPEENGLPPIKRLTLPQKE